MLNAYWKQAGIVLIVINVLTILLLYRCHGSGNIDVANGLSQGWRQFSLSSGIKISDGNSDDSNVDINVDWKSIPRKAAPNLSLMNEKWIVLTSIFAPTEDVAKLADVPGWRVVVVGDTKTPENWSHKNCVFLSVKKQLEMGYLTPPTLPFKSYTRKDVGYLYAIEHGAKYIYETDDDNSPTSGKIEFDPELKEDYFSYASNEKLVNPYSYFGQSTIWPRGYPLNKIADPDVTKYKKCSKVNALIQQGVVDGDPDIDAIFRLTRKDVNIQLDLKFDPTAKPLVLPKGTFTPFNSQNTLFLNDAFFMLLLPHTVTFRVTDIWRGYWGQRLIWDVNGQLSFFSPNAYQKRTAHDYLVDFIEEQDLYYKTNSLIEFLGSWKSEKPHLFDRVLELYLELAKRKFIGYKDVVTVKAWLMDLVSIGYAIPNVKDFQTHCDGTIIDRIPVEQKSSYLRLGKKLTNILQ